MLRSLKAEPGDSSGARGGYPGWEGPWGRGEGLGKARGCRPDASQRYLVPRMEGAGRGSGEGHS